QVIDDAKFLKHQETSRRHNQAENNLITILNRSRRRVCQNEKSKEQGCVKIGGAKDLGKADGVCNKPRCREKRKISSEEYEHQRDFVHFIRDEDSRGKKNQQREGGQFRQSAPPVLRGIPNIKHNDERERSRIEYVCEASPKHIFAYDSDS